MRLTWLCAAICSVTLAASFAQAENFTRYHFKRPVDMRLDPTRLAVQATPANLAAIKVAGFAHDPASTQLPLPGWRLLSSQKAKPSSEEVARTVAASAAAGVADFVSPVFLDDRGDPIVISQDLLIGVRRDVPVDRAREIVSAFGEIVAQGIGTLPNAYKVRSTSRDGLEVLRQANQLAVMDEIEFAEPDLIVTDRQALIPNDPMFPSCWGLRNTGQFFGAVPGIDMGAVEAWETTTGSAAIITVVFDRGVQSTHPDLSGRILTPGFDATGQGGAGEPVSPCDNHGTAVAGCIVARINNGIGTVGIAPDTRVAAARTSIPNVPCNGSGTFQFSWIADSLAWAQSIGARVTNNSSSFATVSSIIDAAYQNTYDAGIIHFASAANDATGTVSYPASIPVVNSVASIDDDGLRSAFSNWGPGLDFSAPGSRIRTTDRTGADGYVAADYVDIDGTSFASPYAAGVAALILSQRPSLTPPQVETILQTTARDLGTPGYDTDYGHGLVRADAAMQVVNGQCPLTWEEQAAANSSPGARQAPATAYDSVRGVTVMFGGRLPPDGALNDTWEWNGLTWARRALDLGPTERVYGKMVFDSARGESIFFGGRRPYTSVYLSETWAWDGNAWTLKTSVGPPPRENCALAFDSIRNRVVLFGGYNGAYLNDIWEWDGASWENRTPPSGPAPQGREGPSMAFDPVRQVCVMHGGLWFTSAATIASDTWTWNGTSWTQVADGPVPRVQHQMVFDHNLQRVVAFGGNSYGSTFYSDLISFDGLGWQGVAVAAPSRRSDVGLAFDASRNRLIMIGGYAGSGVVLGDTWEFDGIKWIPQAGPSPSPRFGAAQVFAPELGGAVMFGGVTAFAQPFSTVSDELWVQSPSGWGRLDSTGPSARVYPCLGAIGNGQLLLFGGLAGSDVGKNDLWRFSGGTWSLLSPSNPPPPRWGAASCAFTSIGKFVVFGGQFNGSLVNNHLHAIDTANPQNWTWYGTGTESGFEPSRRDYPMMAYDPVRDEAILFGGRGSSGFDLDDIWRLRFVAGTPEWTQMNSLGIINGWRAGAMFWDPGRQRIVLYGKQQFGFEPGSISILPTVYEWTGSHFIPVAREQPPSLRRFAAMGPTSPSGDIRLFGGLRASDSAILGDTWAFNGVAEPGFPSGLSGGGDFERGDTITLSDSITVGQSPSLRWTRNAIPLSDGPTPSGSSISGSHTATLVITNAQPADAGTYRLTATNPCGSAESATVLVDVTVPCPADFNGVNALTVQDIFDFLAAWFANDPQADFNGVNGLTVQDIFDFLAAWFQGCD